MKTISFFIDMFHKNARGIFKRVKAINVLSGVAVEILRRIEQQVDTVGELSRELKGERRIPEDAVRLADKTFHHLAQDRRPPNGCG